MRGLGRFSYIILANKELRLLDERFCKPLPWSTWLRRLCVRNCVSTLASKGKSHRRCRAGAPPQRSRSISEPALLVKSHGPGWGEHISAPHLPLGSFACSEKIVLHLAEVLLDDQACR